MNDIKTLKHYSNDVYIPLLTSDEVTNIGYYTETGYMEINRALRLKKLTEIKEFVQSIDSALKKFNLPIQIRTYRTVSLPEDALINILHQIDKGIIYTDTYLSTSVTNYYKGRKTNKFPNVFEFEITLYPGTLCSYIESIFSRPYENELLIGRMQTQEVLDFSVDEEQNVYLVKTRIK